MAELRTSSPGTVSTVRRCAREGCGRRKQAEGYCSPLCMEIDRRLTTVRLLIGRKGISRGAAELWAAAVSLSDQLSEVHRLESLLESRDAAG